MGEQAAAAPPLEWNQVFIGSRCSTACGSCGERSIADVDVNIGYHLHMNTSAEMYMRILGTRINGTVERDASDVVRTLTYVQGVLERVVTGDAVYIGVSDPAFDECVVSVLGAVELLRCAELRWDGEGQALYFLEPRPDEQAQPQAPSRWVSRKAAAVLRMVRAELALLHQGRRLHTRSVHGDIEGAVEQFHSLQAEYQRGDSYPVYNDFLQWMKLRDFFALAGNIVADKQLAHQYLSYAEHASRYCERVLSYIELHNAENAYRASNGNVLSNCSFSEDLQMARYLRKSKQEKETAAAASASVSAASASTWSDSHVTPHTEPLSGFSTPASVSLTPLSPECTRSPAMTLTRTPAPLHKRSAFQAALPPSPSCLMREPGSEYAGLLNVVQNCFMNCLLQAYFTCRQFAKTVLDAPTEWVEGGTTKDCSSQVRVIQRLQTVFAYLQGSSAACVNPEHVLEAVGECNPHFMNGGQHDPQEFADAFIDMLSRGFETLDKASSGPLVQQLQDLVYGETVEVSVDREGAHTSAEGRVERALHFVPLYLPGDGEEPRGALAGTPFAVPLEGGTASTAPLPPPPCGAPSSERLRRPLDLLAECSSEDRALLRLLAGVVAEVEVEEEEEDAAFAAGGGPSAALSPPPMRVPSGMVSIYSALDQLAIDFKDESASMQATLKSFRKLPHLLMFFLPARTMGAEHRALCFDPVLYLDRYVDQADANAARDECRARLAEQQALERRLAQSERAAAEINRTLSTDLFDAAAAADLEAIGSGLAAAAARAQGDIAANRRAIRKAYAEVDRRERNTYHLHAVIVHKRIGRDCGHYFSYALDTRAKDGVRRWIKFDDTRVSPVSESEVFSEETRQNVYCMFYESAESAAKGRDVDVTVCGDC